MGMWSRGGMLKLKSFRHWSVHQITPTKECRNPWQERSRHKGQMNVDPMPHQMKGTWNGRHDVRKVLLAPLTWEKVHEEDNGWSRFYNFQSCLVNTLASGGLSMLNIGWVFFKKTLEAWFWCVGSYFGGAFCMHEILQGTRHYSWVWTSVGYMPRHVDNLCFDHLSNMGARRHPT